MGLFSKARSTLRKKAREAEQKEIKRRQKRERQKQALKEATADASTIVKASRPGRAARAGVKASEKTVDVGARTIDTAARGLEKVEEKGGESGFRIPDPSELDAGIDPLSSSKTKKKKGREGKMTDDLDIDMSDF